MSPTKLQINCLMNKCNLCAWCMYVCRPTCMYLVYFLWSIQSTMVSFYPSLLKQRNFIRSMMIE